MNVIFRFSHFSTTLILSIISVITYEQKRKLIKHHPVSVVTFVLTQLAKKIQFNAKATLETKVRKKGPQNGSIAFKFGHVTLFPLSANITRCIRRELWPVNCQRLLRNETDKRAIYLSEGIFALRTEKGDTLCSYKNGDLLFLSRGMGRKKLRMKT